MMKAQKFMLLSASASSGDPCTNERSFVNAPILEAEVIEAPSLCAISRWPEFLPKSVRRRCLNRPEVAGDTVAWLAAERQEWPGGAM
ncbi:uncharacterized protein THITE_2124508 [Thermothielavioides terrestris NRRL 8126]|uniref:Uncharacterized protein n=1 Tax=Thermothielavioides terrestris (strain ATCC 38088 / NRRL 8126) TaxID=578455 RepID=G2RFX1_THETT|nr:uncharacterized protein THITE_2124508 [Thermothielavioides terrestris NRRL 8126]AEO71725.1 hypothetical protein THITE_2124508 [Thermothielavioides terrestris NRRL 8126]